jgi:hypothetical protein
MILINQFDQSDQCPIELYTDSYDAYDWL